MSCSALSANSTKPSILNLDSIFSIGGNLEGVKDWSRSNVFVNLVKQSRGFNRIDKYWDKNFSVSRDKDGWPKEDFGIYLMTGGGADSRLYPGVYKFRFIGVAEVNAIAYRDKILVRNVIYDAENNITTGEIVYPDSAKQFSLSFKKTKSGVRDLKIIRPGYSFDRAGEHQIFTDELLDHLNRFDVLRFINWTQTNASSAVKWQDRPKLSDPVYTSAQGVPWELVADLANILKKDVWINVPHLADKNYVENLAELFATRLNPQSLLWLEYSNEIWNWSFPQAQWNLVQARKEVANGNSLLNFDKSKNEGYWAWRRVALRTKDVGDVFRREFSKRNNLKNLKIVLSGQFAQLRSYEESLKFHKFHYSNPAGYYACLGAGVYFNSASIEKLQDVTPDQVLLSLRNSLNTNKKRIVQAKAFSEKHGIPFCAYEAGPDTFGANHISAKKIANDHDLMGDMIYELLDYLFANNFINVNWYLAGATSWSSRYGAWGLTDDMSDQNTSKIQAIDNFINRNTE